MSTPFHPPRIWSRPLRFSVPLANMLGLVLCFVSLAPAEAEIADAVLDSLRENPPRTVSDRLRTVETLLNVNEGELARKYLEPVLQAQLSDEQLKALNTRFGASYFLRLMREPALEPLGDQFAIRVFEAATRAARDPRQVQALVDQLLAASDTEAVLLVDQLMSAGPAGTAALITQLSQTDPTETKTRRRLVEAVSLGGRDAVPVIEAGVDAGNAEVAAAAILASRDLWLDFPRVRDAALTRYLDPLDSPARQAARALATRYYGRRLDSQEVGCWLAEQTGRELHTEELDGEVWFWLEEESRFGNRRVGADLERYYRAARLARSLYAQHPQNPDAAPLYALTAAGLAKWQVGLNRPLPLGSTAAGAMVQAQFVQETLPAITKLAALDWALNHNAPAAALGVIELLAQSPAEHGSLLSSPHGQPSPLAAALRSPYRRVRWAAAETIMQLHPAGDFKGACDLASFYKKVVTSRGERGALVIDPNADRAALVAGNLAALGFAPVVTRNGMEAMTAVVNSPDLEIIVLSEQVYEPAYGELLQELRHDYRARQLPLAVLGAVAEPSVRQQILMEPYANVTFFPYPVDVSSAAILASRLQQLVGSGDDAGTGTVGAGIIETAAERLAHVPVALQRLTELSEHSRALADPGEITASLAAAEGAASIPLLANLGTPAAQYQLLQLASDPTEDEAQRMAAAEALHRSMNRFGINLSMQEIRGQLMEFDRQTQPADFDKASRTLWEVLEMASRQQANG